MPTLPLATQTYSRDDYRLPHARVFNLFAEAAGNKVALLPRPGMQRRFEAGLGPIRSMFQQAGVFGSGVFIASGNQLYRKALRITTGVGGNAQSIAYDVDSPTIARFAASKTQMSVVSGGYAYTYQDNGSGSFTITRLIDAAIPAAGFSDVKQLGSRFYYTVRNSDKVLFSDLDDATGLDALQYFTVEGAADPIVACEVLGDRLIFFGAGSIEAWSETGNADNPLQPDQGVKQDKGCLAQATVVPHDNTIFFLRNDLTVCRYADPSQVISTPEIEEKLRKCNDLQQIQPSRGNLGCTAYSIGWDGHSFYVLNIPGQGTFAFDSATGLWCEWGTHNQVGLRASCGLVTSQQANGALWLGDHHTGMIWKLDPEVYEDAGLEVGARNNKPIQRICSTAYPVEAGVERCDVVMLNASRGTGNSNEPNPVIEMRYSDDAGQTWSKWEAAPMGKKGQFESRAEWRRKGQMRSPGRGFEWRCSDPVLSVFKSATLNEPRP